MSKKEFRKLEIADEFLQDAADAYVAGKYFSALHLAGAAEDILTGIIRARTAAEREEKQCNGFKLKLILHGEPSPREAIFDSLVKNAQNSSTPLTSKDVSDKVFRAKNSIKHITERWNKHKYELVVELDPQQEAKFMLLLALMTYVKLGYTPRGAGKQLYIEFMRQPINR